MALQIGNVLLRVLEDLLELLLGGAVCLVFDHFLELSDVLGMLGQSLVGGGQVLINLLNRFLQVVFFLKLLGQLLRVLLMRLLLLCPFHELFSLLFDCRLTPGGVNFTLLRLLGKRIMVATFGDHLILLRCFGSDLVDYGVIIVDINEAFIEI